MINKDSTLMQYAVLIIWICGISGICLYIIAIAFSRILFGGYIKWRHPDMWKRLESTPEERLLAGDWRPDDRNLRTYYFRTISEDSLSDHHVARLRSISNWLHRLALALVLSAVAGMLLLGSAALVESALATGDVAFRAAAFSFLAATAGGMVFLIAWAFSLFAFGGYVRRRHPKVWAELASYERQAKRNARGSDASREMYEFRAHSRENFGDATLAELRAVSNWLYRIAFFLMLAGLGGGLIVLLWTVLRGLE